MRLITILLLASSTLITSVLSNAVLAHEYASGKIEIEHPWSRPTPPGAAMGVGYMVISNHGDSDITLVSASTPRARHVSIHETVMEDGVMRMQPLKQGLEISAGASVKLKPHSYHLMLEKLAKPLKEGERIPLALEFAGAGSMNVELQVESLDADMGEPEMDHSMHEMDH